MRGSKSYHAGLAAEDLVAQYYERAGYCVAARRWRGGGAEIDLILRQGAMVVFVEVKHSASRDQALARISAAQMQRMMASAAQFLAGEPAGQLTESRLDIALVDGIGKVEVIENAYGQG
ncbi:YraN family protein [Phaeobacter porticola]|uniref:YraN family protein n=1 Tax=Phaeobacter porticola TaxID=1844006 RepID=UPI00093002D4|nr:YraN family protein [Phaeobacter porticola]